MHIPDKISKWIRAKNWTLHEHQIRMFKSSECSAQLLIAPTGSGKTLAGFLPTIADLYLNPSQKLHTLYISPLKALASDMTLRSAWKIERETQNSLLKKNKG